MTNENLEKNREEIIRKYLDTGTTLNLSNDLGIYISSSTEGIYHVFIKGENNDLVHQYSIGSADLKKISKVLKINTIKNIYIDSKYLELRNRKIKETVFNPLDFENMK